MNGGIYWLASYPKSGNTWMRSFIANLTHEEDTEVDINALNTGAISSARGWIEDTLGFDIGALSPDEIDKLRPGVYRQTALQATEFEYHKIHDAYTCLPSGDALIPADATTGALYIIRNPLDVAISFAHHSHKSIDQAIENMANPKFVFAKNKKQQNKQLRQRLLSWSMHVSSWVNADELNRLVVRYEDMKLVPEKTFTKVAKFLNLPTDNKQIKQAISTCNIKKLQQQEQEKGFNEKSARAKSFFRKGIIGDWQQTLSKKQIDTIIGNHFDVMQQFGYLDKTGQPLVEPAEMRLSE